MKSLTDLIWTKEDDDIITIQGADILPGNMTPDCEPGDGSYGGGISSACGEVVGGIPGLLVGIGFKKKKP